MTRLSNVDVRIWQAQSPTRNAFLLEYNIIFPTLENTGRKPCSIREQIIGIAMASGCDFDKVTCIWTHNEYEL